MFTASWIHYVLPALTAAHASTVHLAVDPICGSFGGSPLDVGKAGGLKPLSAYTDIIAFGDGYTDAGRHAFGPPAPPVITPPNPRAGGRNSNGLVWAEYLAAKNKANLQDYAVTGSVIDATEWEYLLPGKYSTNADLVYQVNNASSSLRRPPPESTLYTIFFGIGDNEQAQSINHWDRIREISEMIVYETTVLLSYPLYAKDFLIIDNSVHSAPGPGSESFKAELFMSLGVLRENFPGINVGFVDFKTLFDGAMADPAAFGYTSTGSCLKGSGDTTVGACANPDSTFYWAPDAPSNATHSIMADYVEKVLNTC